MADAKIVIIGGAADDQDHDIPDNTDPAWRVHQGATDYIAVDTSEGEESVGLVSSGTGTVGIGSGFTTPQELLHLAKPDDTAAYIRFTTLESEHGSGNGGYVGLNSGEHGMRLYTREAWPVTIGTTNLPRMVIAAGGNVTMNAGLSVANTGTLGTSSVAIGEDCTATGANAISVGFNAKASNTKALALGNGAQSNQAGGIAIGGSCQANASNSISIASNSANTVAGADNSIAFGYYSQTMQPFEMTFSNVPYLEDRKGCAQRKFVSGQCQTTNDDVTAMLNSKSGGAGNGAIALVVNTTNAYQTDSGASDYYSNTALFRIRMISSVTSAGSSFAVGDFLCREYNLAIKWFYSTSASTIEVFNDISGTIIGENPTALVGQNTTLFSSRENVRSNKNTDSGNIAHATTGIIDSIELTTANSAERGSWNLKVKSGDSSATIRHSCFIDQVDHLLI